MICHLLLALTLATALLPAGRAAAQEVTWQDVAQSLFIIAGTPVPYESPLLTEDDLRNRRVVQVENPVYLKGQESDVPVLLMMVPYELVLWNQPTIFFLRKFTATEGPAGREIYGHVTWYGNEGMVGLDYGPRPRLYTDNLASKIEELIGQNERHRRIGAAYKPADDDPLLALIKQDLEEIAKPVDFSEGRDAEKIKPHSLAIRRLMYRGEDIVPRLVFLLESKETFPAGYIIADPTHFQWTDIGPPPSAGTMAEAIEVLLGYWSGFIFGWGRVFPEDKANRDLWYTYLGYQLSGIDPSQPSQLNWPLIARSQLIIEGTLTVTGEPNDRDISERHGSIWATLSDLNFLKGKDQGGPYRVPLNNYWIRRAKDIEGRVVVFSSGKYTSTNDQKPLYGLVHLQRSEGFNFVQLDSLLAADQHYRKIGAAFHIDTDGPYWTKLKSSLKNVATASGEAEVTSAVQRVVEFGEPAVTYLIALLISQDPWDYGEIFSFFEEPWRGDPPTLYAENWGHLAMQLLSRITEQPLSQHQIGYRLTEEPDRSRYWSTYLGHRLSTPEGRLALSHDPAVSKAEKLRRAIAARLPIGSTRVEVAAFFVSQGIDPVYDKVSYYGKTTPRYQAVVPDPDADDDLDETVVVHIFLDKDARLIGSDVRYLFDLYR